MMAAGSNGPSIAGMADFMVHLKATEGDEFQVFDLSDLCKGRA